jgi:hypothetical protein
MVVYGWIPLKEFKSLPINVTLALFPKVQEEYKKMEEWRILTVRLLAGFVGAKKLRNYK